MSSSNAEISFRSPLSSASSLLPPFFHLQYPENHSVQSCLATFNLIIRRSDNSLLRSRMNYLMFSCMPLLVNYCGHLMLHGVVNLKLVEVPLCCRSHLDRDNPSVSQTPCVVGFQPVTGVWHYQTPHSYFSGGREREWREEMMPPCFHGLYFV